MATIKRHLPTLFTLLFFNIIVFARLIFHDNNGVPYATIPFDFDAQYSVWLVYIGDCFKSGFFPLWTPYIAAGTPFFINPQSQLYSPLTLLIAPTLGYTQHGAQLQSVFILFFGGCGAYALAYTLWRSRWAGLITAVCFNFTSAIFGNLEHTTIISAAALLPWLFWVTTMSATGERRWAFPALAFFIYFLITSGYPGVILMALLWLLAYTVYLVYLREGATWAGLRLLVRHGLAWLLGLGLAAAHWLPIVIHRKEFTRGAPLSLDVALSGGNLFFKHLWGMLFLFMTENPLPGADIDISMRGTYFGALAIPLALAAVILIKDKIIPPLVILAVLSLLMACGGWFFGRVFLHALFPMLNMSRFPSADSRSLMALGLAVLAGGGAALLQANVEAARRFVWQACLVLLGALLVGLFALRALYPPDLYNNLIVNYVTAEILFVCLALLALRAFAGRRLAGCLVVLLVLELGTCVAANMKIVSAPLRSPQEHQEVVARHRRAFTPEAAYSPRLTVGGQLVGEESGRAYLQKNFYLSDYNPLRLYRLERLLASGYTEWLLNGARVVALPPESRPQNYAEFQAQAQPVEFAISSYTPNRVVYQVNAAQDALLVFNEVYFPGWRATVDGRAAALTQACGGLRALRVGAGRHQVVTTFSPRSFYVGITVSLLSLVLFLAWLFAPVYLARRARRKQTAAPPERVSD
jgi:hypothetical protein